jgi:hypothetical protein
VLRGGVSVFGSCLRNGGVLGVVVWEQTRFVEHAMAHSLNSFEGG